MRALFGHYCSASTFAHDEVMRAKVEARDGQESRKRRRGSSSEADTQRSRDHGSPPASPMADMVVTRHGEVTERSENGLVQEEQDQKTPMQQQKLLERAPAPGPQTAGPDPKPDLAEDPLPPQSSAKEPRQQVTKKSKIVSSPLPSTPASVSSVVHPKSRQTSLTRRLAYLAASEECEEFTWHHFSGIVCAGNNHSEKEVEL